uniref:Putative helicase n=1 Tax=uncultured marine group II/III euryarchaeote AD1000_88_G11 TaxID=1457822 RepID=A0A075G069_9EURY|nr:putative helicase [uncultured marine group II/III euryarchaeote AD1000_88_G11]
MSNLAAFLKTHQLKKGSGKRFTHTRIPSKSGDPLVIYPASYAIPKETMNEFYKLYHKQVFVDKIPEYLTERQTQSGGPILVDLDFRYGTHIDQRQHDDNHITDIIDLYLAEIQEILHFTQDTKIPIFILEKPTINIQPDIVKDGIHIVIGISMHHVMQQILRKHIMTNTEGSDGKIDYILEDLPLTNTYDEVLDYGITKGHTNWQLYGSRKPNCEAYELTKYLICEWKHEAEEWEWEQQNIDDIDKLELLTLISAQNNNHPKIPITEKYKQEYEILRKGHLKKIKKNKKIKQEEINDSSMLEKACKDYLDNLSEEEYQIKETHNSVMALPKKFYDQEPLWIKVGWACYNTDKRMFPTWMLFSSQSSKFNFEDIPDYYTQWKKMKKGREMGVSCRSIMFWLKETNRAEFDKIQKETVEFYMNKVIDSPTETDIAAVLYQMYKDKYACVSVENKTWYEFSNHRWQREDSGNSLRHNISRVISPKFKELSRKKVETLHQLENDPDQEDKVSILSHQIKKCSNICLILKKTSHKNNIMREAQEIFYDKHFFDKLDQNPYLLSCENGVLDFKASTIDTIFRKGKAEDYLSLNTGVCYKSKIKDTIKREIQEFMKQLFPITELYNYMWEHLASTLLGTNQNQTFNIYTGDGRNGKSKLVEFMALILGDYKGTVPITLITKKRGGIGGVSPEIAQLMGKRYAVMQEPTKGDKINEGIMKELTGGDPITGRSLYKDSITFTPQFKLAVCTNNLFDIHSNDNGTWRRIRVCPYMSEFNEAPFKETSKLENPYQYKVNKNIDKEKFPLWKETFFAMLVEIAFKTKGNVRDCKIVMAASDEYRDDQNCLAQFASETIEQSQEGVLKITQIWQLLGEWWKENGIGMKPKRKELQKFLNKKFGKIGKDRMWTGIRQKDFSFADKLDEDGD